MCGKPESSELRNSCQIDVTHQDICAFRESVPSLIHCESLGVEFIGFSGAALQLIGVAGREGKLPFTIF